MRKNEIIVIDGRGKIIYDNIKNFDMNLNNLPQLILISHKLSQTQTIFFRHDMKHFNSLFYQNTWTAH